MANKMTIKDYFNEVIALARANDREDLVEFAEGRIAVLEKKSANKKPSATQEANEALKVKVFDVLSAMDGRATVSEVMAADAEIGGLSNQKVTAIMRMLIADGKVKKEVDKKKSYFVVV